MTLREEAEQLAEDRPTSLSDDLYQWAMDAEEMLWKLSAQAAQPAPRRLTEAEITLLVEAYYEDFGSAPPDLIRQVEGLIFGDAQPAQVPAGWKLVPVEPTNEMNCAGNTYAELTANQPKGMWWWGRVYQAMLSAAPSTKEQT